MLSRMKEYNTNNMPYDRRSLSRYNNLIGNFLLLSSLYYGFTILAFFGGPLAKVQKIGSSIPNHPPPTPLSPTNILGNYWEFIIRCLKYLSLLICKAMKLDFVLLFSLFLPDYYATGILPPRVLAQGSVSLSVTYHQLDNNLGNTRSTSSSEKVSNHIPRH